MKIFLSYRRQDSEWVSLSIYKSLQEQLPNDLLFKDVNVIKAGENYADAIIKNLQTCDVLLVIIGSEWLNAKDEDGEQRLFKPNDYVCLEIATAIQKGKKVIPVLINNTVMPEEDELPAIIKELHKLQAVRINNSNFEMDVFTLANAINDTVGKKNQFADMIRDVASGKISQKELIQPQPNSAYALFCIFLGVLILLFNTDNVGILIVCLLIIGLGGYAYLQSQKVKNFWLNKNFEAARSASKNTKLISLITPTIGVILMFVIILLQGYKLMADGGLEQVKKLMDTTKVESTINPPKEESKPLNVIPQQETNYSNSNNQLVYTHQVTQDTFVYLSPNLNDITDKYLYQGSTVQLIEIQDPFAKVETILPDGKKYTFWISRYDLMPLQ